MLDRQEIHARITETGQGTADSLQGSCSLILGWLWWQDLEKEVRAVLEAHPPSLDSETYLAHTATEHSVDALQSLSLGVMPV